MSRPLFCLVVSFAALLGVLAGISLGIRRMNTDAARYVYANCQIASRGVFTVTVGDRHYGVECVAYSIELVPPDDAGLGP
jgi:hypothetical protein